jgi:hypothetical protein
MSRIICTTILTAASCLLAMAAANVAVAFPSRGAGCAACHDSAGGMALAISPNPIDIKKSDHELLTFQVTSMGNASNANISVQGF